MRILLIKRGKVTHAGIRTSLDKTTYRISVCSGLWNEDDKTKIGEETEVTCKRCLKVLARCDDNGVVIV